MRHHRASATLVLFLVLATSPLASARDEFDLRWENVEGAPIWLGGEPPRFTFEVGERRVDGVTLDPGQETRLHLPASSWVLFVRDGGAWSSEDLEVYWGGGARLAAQVQLASGEDESFAYLAPTSWFPSVLRLVRPPDASGPVGFSMFVSRHDPGKPLRSYKEMPPEESEAAGVEVPGSGWSSGAYRVVAAGIKRSVVLAPGRHALVTRLLIPRGDGSRLHGYELHVETDTEKRAYQVTRLSERRAPIEYRVDGRTAGYLAEERVLMVEAPEGGGRVSLTCDADVAFRFHDDDRDCWIHSEPISMFGASSVDLIPPGFASLHADVGLGLSTAQALRELTTSWNVEPFQRTRAKSFYSRHSQYRTLLPMRKYDFAEPRIRCFSVAHVPGPYSDNPTFVELDPGVHLRAALLGSDLRTLSMGHFVRIPHGREHAHEYPLSGRGSVGRLRMSVLDSQQELRDLQVQFDDHEPIRLLHAESGVEDRLAASLAEAALTAVIAPGPAETRRSASVRLGFIPDRAPLASAHSVEIPIPAGARVFRLWSTVESDTQAGVAVHERGVRYFEVSEREFLGFQARITGTPREMLFWNAYQNWVACEGRHEELEDWLHWAPAFRLLDSLHREGTGDVIVDRDDHVAPSDEVDDYLVRRRARVHESQGEWLCALEAWSEGVRSRKGEARIAAELGRLRALSHLGETALAERQARGLIQYHPDRRLRDATLEWLLSTNTENERLRLQVLAIHARTTGAPRWFGRLAEELCRQGHDLESLQIAASLPLNSRPTETMLRAAANLGWWRAFDRYLSQLPRSQRPRWRALKYEHHGEYESAQIALQRGGPEAEEELRTLRSARAIATRLRSADIGARARAILEWEQWWQQQSGDHRWSEAAIELVDYAGGVQLRSRMDGRQTPYYRATPLRALRAQVLGPADVLVEVRPLHAGSATRRLDGWLELGIDGRLHPVHVASNLPSESFFETADKERPGVRVVERLRLGPGLHDLELRSREFPVLARVRVARPVQPMGPLPEFNRHTALAALRGAAGRWHETGNQLYLYDNGHRSLLPVRRFEALGASEDGTLEVLRDVDPVLAARLSLRLHDRPPTEDEARWLEVLARAADPISDEERALALHRAGLLTTSQVAVNEPFDGAVPRSWTDGVRLREGLYQHFIDAAETECTTIEELRGRIRGLCYIADRDPTLHDEALRQAFELAQKPGVPASLGGIRARLLTLNWQRIDAVSGHGGLRVVETPAWQPESPLLRVRAAYLPEASEGTRRVSAGRALNVTLENRTESVLRLDLSVVTLRYTRPEAIAAQVRVDGGEPSRFALGVPGQIESVVVPFPVGSHRVEVTMEPALPGHYLQVRVRDREILDNTNGATEKPHDADSVRQAWQSTAIQRRFHVASKESPLELNFVGPALLRVDELRGGVRRVEYLSFPEGPHSVTLKPREDAEEALFRVFRGEFPNRLRSWPLPPRNEPLVVPESTWSVDSWPRDIVPDDIVPDNGDGLGGQEDGTWSVRSTFRQRRRFDEDPTQSRTDGDHDHDEYTELSGTHRYYSESRDVFFETGSLARGHDSGGPTLGFWHRQYHRPDGLPLFVRLEGRGYLQWPQASDPSVTGGSEHSVSLRSEFWRRYRSTARLHHVPSLALFGRTASISDDSQFAPGTLDPDVYSDYRRDHRWGAVLSHSWQYEPVLDNQWVASVSMITNEDMTLDQWRAELGVRQYYRGVIVSADYRMTRYLNDGDRARGRTRDRIHMALAYDHWSSRHRRHEYGLRFEQDLSDGETGFMMYFALDFGRSRGYRDHAPDRLTFRRLRDFRRPPARPSGRRP